jgi:hypothetical protein
VAALSAAMEVEEEEALVAPPVDDSPSAAFSACPECGTTKITVPNLQLRFSTCCGRCMSDRSRQQTAGDAVGCSDSACSPRPSACCWRTLQVCAVHRSAFQECESVALFAVRRVAEADLLGCAPARGTTIQDGSATSTRRKQKSHVRQQGAGSGMDGGALESALLLTLSCLPCVCL